MGYPPAEGELDQADSPEAAVEDADHVGVQLDALAGMVARQGQALTPVAADATPQADAGPQDPVIPDATTAEAEEHSAESAHEIDPLTAPLAALTGATTATAPAPSADPVPSATELTAPASAPEADVEKVGGDLVDVESPVATPESGNTRTTGRSTAILRPAQLLIVATAALNLILVGLSAVLGTASGSMTIVVLGMALITLAVWTGAAVTFLHWVSRAHAHVAATAASRQRHGASMSLIGWFIPIAGFVIGYRVLQDLWTGSDPATREQANAAPAKARSIDIWLLGVLTAALFGFAMPLALGESALWRGLSAIGFMVAALSLASTMGAISAWQLDQDDETAANEAATEADTSVDSDATKTPEEVAAPSPAPTPEAVSASAR